MKLKLFLDSKNLIHSRFAERCGIKRSAFCRYVNGDRKPDPITAMKIKRESKELVTEFNKIISDHLDLILKSSSI
jgi:transcriptional regulator with XRE-family HTH domain